MARNIVGGNPQMFVLTLHIKLTEYSKKILEYTKLDSKFDSDLESKLDSTINQNATKLISQINSFKLFQVRDVTVEVIKSLLETASERPRISTLIHNTVTEILNEYFSVSPSMPDIDPIKKAKFMGRKMLSGMAGLTQFLLTPALLVTAYVIDPFYSIADNLITGNVSFDPLYSDIANTLNNARDKIDYVTRQKQNIQEGIVTEFNQHLTMAKRRIPGYVAPQKKNKYLL